MFYQLNYEDFCNVRGSEFNVAGAGEAIRLTLFEISELRESPQSTSFSLLFKGPADFVLEQKSHELYHEKLGDGELFIVPIREDPDGIVYEALFNRMPEN